MHASRATCTCAARTSRRSSATGHELTPDRPLYQEGNFAAKETVTLIGPRSRLIPNLRILGPLRKESQIELAFTDAILLGLDAPVRLSGNIDGTPGAFVMGPKGIVELTAGRHPRGDSRPHEPGRGGALRREAGRRDEAAGRRPGAPWCSSACWCASIPRRG